MKKLFTSFLLLMAGVMVVQARLWFNGTTLGTSSKTFNSSNTSVIKSGTVTWDGNKTLTLDNVKIDVPQPSSDGYSSLIFNEEIDNMVVFVMGTCTVTTKNHCFITASKLTFIRGNNTSSILTINDERASDRSYLYEGAVNETNDLIYFQDVYCKITSANGVCVSGGGSNSLRPSRCKLELNTSSSQYGATYNIGGVSHYATYYVNGESYSSSEKAIVKNGTVAKSVTIDGNLYFGYQIVDTNAASVNLTGNLSSGTATYYVSEKRLKLEDAKITTSAFNVISNNTVDGLTIELVGTGNELKTSDTSSGSVIRSTKNLTIKGDKWDECLVNIDGWIGVYMPSGDLTIEKCYIIGACKGYGLDGYNNNNLTVNGAALVIRGEEKGTILKFASCTMSGGSTVLSSLCPGVCYRKALKGFGKADATEPTKDAIWLGPADTSYPVYVLGQQLNNYNYEDVAVDGLTAGKISYDKDNKVLTVDGVTIESPDGNNEPGIKADVNGLQVTLSGTNTVTTNGNALHFEDITELNGEGKLTAESKNGHGLYYNWTSMTINVNNEVHFKGKVNGYDGAMLSSEKLILKKAGNKSDYYFQGEEHAMWRMPSLVLEDMDFFYNSTYGTPGCYYGKDYNVGTIMQNGGTVVKGDKVVNFYNINDSYPRYDLYVAGTQVTGCNRNAIGSPYIKAGGPTAVSYSSSLNTLTLKDATIEYTDDSNKDFKALTNNGINDLNIKIEGDNTINTAGYMALEVGYNMTTKIIGSGKLNAQSSWYAVRIHSYGTLDIGDHVEIDAQGTSSGIANNMGGNNGETLIIRDKALVKAKGGSGSIQRLNDIQLKDDIELKEPTGAEIKQYENGWGVFVGGSLTSKQVIFADKSVNAIDAVEVENNADIRDIYDASGRQTQNARPGLNIVRMSDGTVRKVMVK